MSKSRVETGKIFYNRILSKKLYLTIIQVVFWKFDSNPGFGFGGPLPRVILDLKLNSGIQDMCFRKESNIYLKFNLFKSKSESRIWQLIQGNCFSLSHSVMCIVLKNCSFRITICVASWKLISPQMNISEGQFLSLHPSTQTKMSARRPHQKFNIVPTEIQHKIW